MSHINIRKHAFFEKMKMILPMIGVMLILPLARDKICICIYIGIMKNNLSLHCYHQLVMFQTPVPEVEIIWDIQQKI